MESKIIIKEKQQQGLSYPCLKQYSLGEIYFIVLFTSSGSGIIIYSNDNIRPVGEYSQSWLESEFTLFDGQVVLSNNPIESIK